MIVKCLCYVFSDTEAPPRFTLRIPLIRTTTEPTPTTTTPAIMPSATAAPITPTPTTTTAMELADNPFSLTDEEIDEMLEVLEQGSVPNQTSVGDTLDQDLLEVLNMDVDSFIV